MQGRARQNQERKSRGGRPGRRGRSAPPPHGAPEESAEFRLNRYIARAGVSSRRKADELIAAGKVQVNGQVVTDFSTRVSDKDEVRVAGRVVSPQHLRYILLNKPADVITTTSDERGRKTVLDLLSLPESEIQGLFPVGRLDRNTVGTLLMTNDGELANRLMHPRYEVAKVYVVRTKDPIKPHQLETLRQGVQLDDGPAAAQQVSYVDPNNHHEVGMLLHEGRNRQVRRMMEALGHEVVHLERISYAGLTTEGVRRGRWRELSPHEVRKLLRQLRLK